MAKKTLKKKNIFFNIMLNAKKTKSKSFKYKGTTYIGKKHKYLGLIYKKKGGANQPLDESSMRGLKKLKEKTYDLNDMYAEPDEDLKNLLLSCKNIKCSPPSKEEVESCEEQWDLLNLAAKTFLKKLLHDLGIDKNPEDLEDLISSFGFSERFKRYNHIKFFMDFLTTPQDKLIENGFNKDDIEKIRKKADEVHYLTGGMIVSTGGDDSPWAQSRPE